MNTISKKTLEQRKIERLQNELEELRDYTHRLVIRNLWQRIVNKLDV